MHEGGKYLEEGSGPGAVSVESGQGLNQIGGSTTEPCLKQNQPNNPEQARKQASEQAPEQFLNLFHQLFKLE